MASQCQACGDFEYVMMYHKCLYFVVPCSMQCYHPPGREGGREGERERERERMS